MNERTNITDQGYSYGGKDYVYETRTNPVTNVPYQVAIEKSVSKPTMQTTTAQRNADVQTQVKYDTMASAKGLSKPVNNGVITPSMAQYTSSAVYDNPNDKNQLTGYKDNSTGVITYNDGSTSTERVNQPWAIKEGDSPDVIASKNSFKTYSESLDKQTKEINDQFEAMKANAPAENQRVIDQIKSKYAKTKAILEQNMANLAGVHEKMGYASGGNRYTQAQSAGILTNDANNAIVKLAELDSLEANELLSAATARNKNDWDALQVKMNMLDKINSEKTIALAKLNDLASEQLKLANTAKKESAIADLYSQGVTDVAGIVKGLANKGIVATIKETAEALKNIVPAGLDELVKTIRTNGAPQDVIQKVLSSGDINSAYENAGEYASGGTGIIGEYNFYKAQALSKGQNPVDFNTYQNLDANRKISIAKAGVSGVSGQSGVVKYKNDLEALIGNAKSALPTKFAQEDFVNNIAKARNDTDKINTIATVVLKNSPGAVREDFINQTIGMKQIEKAIALLDSKVQTGAINNATQYTYNIVGKDYDPKIAELQQLITSAIQPYRSSVTGAAWGAQEEKEYQSLFGSTKYSPSELKQRLEGVKEIMKDKTTTALNAQVNPLGSDNQFNVNPVGEKLIVNEEKAKQNLKVFISTNPKKATEVASRIKSMEKSLGRPITTVEFYEVYPEYQP